MFLEINESNYAFSRRTQRFDYQYASTEPFDYGSPVDALTRPQIGVKLTGSNFADLAVADKNPQISTVYDNGSTLTRLEQAIIDTCTQEKVLYRSGLSCEASYPVFESGSWVNTVYVMNVGTHTEKLLTDTIKANKQHGVMVQTALVNDSILFMTVLHVTEAYNVSTLGLARSSARKLCVDLYIIPRYPGRISENIQAAQESSLGVTGSGYCNNVPWLPLWRLTVWYMEGGFGMEYNLYFTNYLSVVSPVIDPRALPLLDYVEYFYKALSYVEVLLYGNYDSAVCTLTDSEAYSSLRSCINALDADRVDALKDLMDNVKSIPDLYQTMLVWVLEWFASESAFTSIKVEIGNGTCNLVDDEWCSKEIRQLVHYGTIKGLTTQDRPVCTRVSDLGGMIVSLCRSNGHIGTTAVQDAPNKILVRRLPDKLQSVTTLRDLRQVLRESDASPHLEVLKGAGKVTDSGKAAISDYLCQCIDTPDGNRLPRWDRVMSSLREIRAAQIELSQLIDETVLNKILMRRRRK